MDRLPTLGAANGYGGSQVELLICVPGALVTFGEDGLWPPMNRFMPIKHIDESGAKTRAGCVKSGALYNHGSFTLQARTGLPSYIDAWARRHGHYGLVNEVGTSKSKSSQRREGRKEENQTWAGKLMSSLHAHPPLSRFSRCV